MASLQARLSALITAIGADVKALQARTPTLLGQSAGPPLGATPEPTKAVEWTYSPSGNPLAKVGAVNPASTTRGELWLRLVNATGSIVMNRLIMGTDGSSDFVPPSVSALPTTAPDGGPLYNGQECYYVADNLNAIWWHLRYSTGSTKWHYVGGPPIEVSENRVFIQSGTLWQTTVGTPAGASYPAITVPLAGDYHVELFTWNMFTNVAGATGAYSYKIGAAVSQFLDGLYFENMPAVPTGPTLHKMKKTFAAGVVLQTQGYISANNLYMNANQSGVFGIRLTPIKVG